jgi:hypothetical protein
MRHIVARFPVADLAEFRSTTIAADGTRRQPAKRDRPAGHFILPMLAALRGTMREAFKLGLFGDDADEYARALSPSRT